MERLHEDASSEGRDRRAGLHEQGRDSAKGVRHSATAPPARAWSFVAGLCLLAAAILWWFSFTNATFVVATLGVVAWFLDLRNQLQPTGIEAGATETSDMREVPHTAYGDEADHHRP